MTPPPTVLHAVEVADGVVVLQSFATAFGDKIRQATVGPNIAIPIADFPLFRAYVIPAQSGHRFINLTECVKVDIAGLRIDQAAGVQHLVHSACRQHRCMAHVLL